MSKMESTCIYCKLTNHQQWISFHDIFEDQHNLNRCENCGIYFLNPQPTTAQLERAYDESYYGVGEKKFNSTVESIVDWFRIRNAKQFAKKITNKARVLDIGCGNGSFLVNLGKQGDFELHGIELKGKSAERAKEHSELNLHIGFLEENTYSKESFDAIILTHVFEHLRNPKETLQVINNIARRGAILQLEIPNVDSWQAQFFKGNWFHMDPPRHLSFFPPEVLKKELSKLGWKVVYESYFSPQYSPFGVQQSLLNVVLSKREVLYEYLKGNKSYTKGHSVFSLVLQQFFHWSTFPLFVFTDIIASTFKKGGTVKLKFQKIK